MSSPRHDRSERGLITPDAGTAPPSEFSFAFIDMAGFIALTEAMGDLDAAEQIDTLCALTEAALSGSTLLVKSIGDAVMLAGATPTDVLTTTLALLAASRSRDRFPHLRAGLHAGSALRRDTPGGSTSSDPL